MGRSSLPHERRDDRVGEDRVMSNYQALKAEIAKSANVRMMLTVGGA